MTKNINNVQPESSETKHKQIIRSIPECINARGLEIGIYIGVISYNDTVLKQIVANGITTISTDFKNMRQKLAMLVRSKKTNKSKSFHRL